MSSKSLSAEAQAALKVVQRLLATLKISSEEGRTQLTSTLHPDGHMCHARYHRLDVPMFHNFKDNQGSLQEYLHEIWERKDGVVQDELIDGEATVFVDHDIAMVWTPYYFLKDGKLSHVGTNIFNLIKCYSDGSREEWEWKIATALDTARPPSKEDEERLNL